MMTSRRTYLITASSGIGAETARQLSGPRACFYLASRDNDKCEQLAAILRASGSEAAFMAGDLTEPSFAPAVVHGCVQRFGRLDALFSVAGISGRSFGDGPVHECTEEGWSKTLETNATTQYRMCREAVRVMLQQEPGPSGERGVVLNMSSILAIHPDARHFATVAYAASKGAIISMSKTMAACYAAQKIRVNAIAPGLVRTPMSARASADPVITGYMQTRQPLLEDVIPVEDVAATCVYLLTDASHSTTGQVIEVDGGWGVA
jgi:NAD(P)-dependent dehydrogenase (short-subunit alcohol dehydrogenase family)